MIDDRNVSLAEAYREYFPIGAAISPGAVEDKQEAVLRKHFSSITAENVMKPRHTQPREGVFTFDDADRIVDYARQHHKKVRGHTLVWHNSTPDWFFYDHRGNLADRETVLGRINDHISAVVRRYKGDIYAWDVVNEVISDKEGETYRDSLFYHITGTDYIKEAFHHAHEVDPNARLFYNDYNVFQEAKATKIETLIRALKDDGVPIHGMGIQGHWSIHGPSEDRIRAIIEQFAALDLQVEITELDVSLYPFHDKNEYAHPPADLLEKQAQRYETIFAIFREYKDVLTNVTLWGVGDAYSWLNHFPVRNRRNWPLLFDDHLQPKEAFRRIVRL